MVVTFMILLNAVKILFYIFSSIYCTPDRFSDAFSHDQGWGEYYSGTRLAQNDKLEYTKIIVLEH